MDKSDLQEKQSKLYKINQTIISLYITTDNVTNCQKSLSHSTQLVLFHLY